MPGHCRHPRVAGDIGVRNLPGRMHPGIGAARNSQRERHPENNGQGVLEDALHGRSIRLSGPAAERRAVISDVQPEPDGRVSR